MHNICASPRPEPFCSRKALQHGHVVANVESGDLNPGLCLSCRRSCHDTCRFQTRCYMNKPSAWYLNHKLQERVRLKHAGCVRVSWLSPLRHIFRYDTNSSLDPDTWRLNIIHSLPNTLVSWLLEPTAFVNYIWTMSIVPRYLSSAARLYKEWPRAAHSTSQGDDHSIRSKEETWYR